MNNIDIGSFKQLLKEKKVNIIDIRSQYDYSKGAILGAINIREDLLMMRPREYLKKNEVYYIYCNNGDRSRNCVRYLNALGFQTVNIEGGYKNYLLIE